MFIQYISIQAKANSFDFIAKSHDVKWNYKLSQQKLSLTLVNNDRGTSNVIVFNSDNEIFM